MSSIEKLVPVSEAVRISSTNAHGTLAAINAAIPPIAQRLQAEVVEVLALPGGACYCGRPDCVSAKKNDVATYAKYLPKVLADCADLAAKIELQRKSVADVLDDLSDVGAATVPVLVAFGTSIASSLLQRANVLAELTDSEVAYQACRLGRDTAPLAIDEDVLVEIEVELAAQTVH